MNSFHYAFKVKDIPSTRKFYMDILGCNEGRSTETWIDFNFFGNQLSAHISNNISALDYCGLVDGIKVPIPHFGCILNQPTFLSIQQKIEDAQIDFIVKPNKRYSGQAGEQLSMFVLDFSGNALEFKSFSNEKEIFLEE